MINKDKIIIMTKLAVYDKNYGESDKRYENYFVEDYVYRRNAGVRFSVLLGTFIILIFYYLLRFAGDNVDVLTLDYRQEVMNIAVFVIIMLFVYTVISSITATVDYHLSERRRRKYFSMIQKLNNLSARKEQEEGEDSDNYGTDIIYTRDTDRRL